FSGLISNSTKPILSINNCDSNDIVNLEQTQSAIVASAIELHSFPKVNSNISEHIVSHNEESTFPIPTETISLEEKEETNFWICRIGKRKFQDHDTPSIITSEQKNNQSTFQNACPDSPQISISQNISVGTDLIPGSVPYLTRLFDKAEKTGRKEKLRGYYYSEEIERKVKTNSLENNISDKMART
ncbi:8148_t:CDS:2, partial [Diversispora eburnea]